MKNVKKSHRLPFFSTYKYIILTGIFVVSSMTVEAKNNTFKFSSFRKGKVKVIDKKFIFPFNINKYKLALNVATDSLEGFLDGVTMANAKNVRVRLAIMQKDKRLLNFTTTLDEAESGSALPDKLNKLKIKDGKSGIATFVIGKKLSPTKDKWAKVQSINFSWNQKNLTVKVKGSPLSDDESNILDFTETIEGLKEKLNSKSRKISEKTSETDALTCIVSFNGFSWSAQASIKNGKISAFVKSVKVTRMPMNVDTGQWKVKGKGTMTSYGKGSLVSGGITGDKVDNVSIRLSGAFVEKTATDSNGAYSFARLPKGKYVVTPVLEGYHFVPTSQSIILDSTNKTDISFNSVAGPATISDDFVKIPAGNFNMGNSFEEGYDIELPIHSVNIDNFYINKYEMSNQKVVDILQWAFDTGMIYADSSTVRFNDIAGVELLKLSSAMCQISFDGHNFSIDSGKETYPCVEISWFGSAACCNFLSLMEGRIPYYDTSNKNCYINKDGYRLPTEAQWEKATRGGMDNNRFSFGDTIEHLQANYYAITNVFPYDASDFQGFNPNYKTNVMPYTAPVTAFSTHTNGYGLINVTGNVREWCNDIFLADWYSQGSATNNNCSGPTNGIERVVRGGSWISVAESSRNSNRQSALPSERAVDIGFRLALPK